MSEKAHTKGPWRLRVKKDEPDEFEAQVCGDIFILADFNGPNYPHQRPNAQLMTAAPEMLEALELHRAYEATPTDRGGKSGPKGRARAKWLAARDAALAKARGES